MTETAPTKTRRVRADEPDLLEGLLTGAGAHVEPLLDVGTTAGGDLLLVVPRPAARLPDLLEAAGWPSPGEAVTVLVPLVQALQRLHAAGVAVGGADASAVVLDAAGSPAWRLRHPVLLRRAGPIAFSAAADRDRESLARLAEGMAGRAGVPLRAEGLAPGELVAALFDAADPLPVRLGPRPAWGEEGPSRLVAPAPPVAAGPSRRLQAVRESLARVRRRTWGLAGAVAVALVLALVLLPTTRSADAAGPSAAAGSGSPAPVPTPAVVVPRALPADRAVPRLLAARAACFAAGAAACLDRVAVPGSPLRAADRAALTAGTDPVLPRGPVEVLSEGGGTVVARVGPAVVVATRQPDGWRLRDVVAEPPG